LALDKAGNGESGRDNGVKQAY
ncbi:potassium-transporting ATPase subunit C, partial [Xanthomonas oryzae pv. oryzae]